jgi:hypothetical protein
MTGTTADTQWKFSATYVVLPTENVDTDQIIPARFLTTTSRAGLGPNAFNDWRYLADGSPNPDFVLNKPESQGAEVLVAGSVTGVHRCHRDDHLDLRGGDVVTDRDGALDAGEAASDLGQPEMPSNEAGFGVTGVDAPDSGGWEVDAGDGTGGGHGESLPGEHSAMRADAHNLSDACIRTQVVGWMS